jgi:hypothetical protein
VAFCLIGAAPPPRRRGYRTFRLTNDFPYIHMLFGGYNLSGDTWMFRIFFLLAALFPAQVDTTFTVEYGGKKYEFHITDQDLQKTPAWAANQENPPLSARGAIDIATKQLAALLPNGKDWRLYSVTLRPIENRWIYLVEFLEPLRGDNAGQQLSSAFQLVVLMNGVAITPKVSP